MKSILPALFAGSLLLSGSAFAETVYVSNYFSDSITAFDPTTNTSTTFGAGDVNMPTGMAFYDGNLYVANAGNDKIEEFSASGAFLGDVASTGSDPTGLAFDAAGNLYVANTGSGTVVKYSGLGGTISDTTVLSGLNGPVGLAFDKKNDLYVADSGSDSITELTQGGTQSSLVFSGTSLCMPYGLAFDNNGNLFVANVLPGSVTEISGSTAKVFAQLNCSLNVDVAVDAAGNIFVTDLADKIVSEYNASGSLIGTFPSNGCGPAGLAIDNSGDPILVPEPSTYAMLFAGLAALYFLRRRRNQQFVPAKI
jgi:DNA-binding beta-propeller fold protein YncE